MNRRIRSGRSENRSEASLDHASDFAQPDTAGPQSGLWEVLHHSMGNRAVGRMVETQRRAASESPVPISPEQQAQIEVARSSGHPLDEDTKDELPPLLGADVPGVRLHEGPTAAALASGLDANAFTQGRDIFLGAGYESNTARGDQTLVHELAHAAQARTAAGTVQREAATATDTAVATPTSTTNAPGSEAVVAAAETEPAAVKHYSLSTDVVVPSDIEDKVSKMADAYYAAKKADIVITDGERTTAQQAEYIYRKLDKDGESDTSTLYGNGENIKAVIAAWKTKKTKDEQIQVMTEALDKQVGEGKYISQHLRNNAVDVRSSDGTDMAELKKAAEANGGSLLDESKKKAGPHYHISF